MKTLGFLILLPFSVVQLHAQNEPSRLLGIGTGWSYAAIKTSNTSPLTYQGSAPPFQLFFENGGTINKHFVQGFYQKLTLRNVFENSVNERRAGFLYSYHRRIWTLKDNLTVYGGGVLNAQTSSRNGDEINSSYGTYFCGLDGSVLVSYSAGRNKVEGQFYATFIAYVRSTSPSLQAGEFSSLAEFNQFTARLAYDHSLSMRFNLGVEYKWNFYNLKRYPEVSSLFHQLIVSIAYKFDL